MLKPKLHHLPRLERSFYRAFAVVHWTFTVQPRIPGWLTESFHAAFRELMFHACHRYQLVCPVYCLMQDHIHLIWMGLSIQIDQLIGMRFLRLQVNRLLAGKSLVSSKTSEPSIQWTLQPQAYDHVLREKERRRNAFAKVCFYILANPVRAELVQREEEWPFSGAIVPGIPNLHPLRMNYWPLFWIYYIKWREPEPVK
jgi:putative transposase